MLSSLMRKTISNATVREGKYMDLFRMVILLILEFHAITKGHRRHFPACADIK